MDETYKLNFTSRRKKTAKWNKIICRNIFSMKIKIKQSSKVDVKENFNERSSKAKEKKISLCVLFYYVIQQIDVACVYFDSKI